MFIVIYTIAWLLSSLGLSLLGFLAGRFGRKLPLLDDALPWTLHWGEILRDESRSARPYDHHPRALPWPDEPPR
jgi:hypothetical protein